MAELILHLGFPKTGSSTIQSTISRNRHRISPRAWFRIRGGKTRKLRAATARFQRRNRDQDRNGLAALLRELGDEITASGKDRALFSDETLVAIDYFHPSGPDYITSAERVMPMIVEAMPQHDIRFVYYTRPVEAWIKSSFKQFVKTRDITETFDEWAAKIPFDLDWDAIEARLKAATDRPVEFVSMESELGDGVQLGSHLFRAIGFTDEEIGDFVVPAPRNESLPAGAVDLLRAVNALDFDEENLWKVRRLIQRNPDCFR